MTEARYIIYRRGMRKKEEKRDEEVCKTIALSSLASYIQDRGIGSGNHIIPRIMIVSFIHPFLHFFVP